MTQAFFDAFRRSEKVSTVRVEDLVENDIQFLFSLLELEAPALMGGGQLFVHPDAYQSVTSVQFEQGLPNVQNVRLTYRALDNAPPENMRGNLHAYLENGSIGDRVSFLSSASVALAVLLVAVLALLLRQRRALQQKLARGESASLRALAQRARNAATFCWRARVPAASEFEKL